MFLLPKQKNYSLACCLRNRPREEENLCETNTSLLYPKHNSYSFLPNSSFTMTPETPQALRQNNFRQTNAYAMQNGLILGVVAITSLGCFVLGLSMPMFSTLSLLLSLFFPIVACLLTLRFRKEVAAQLPFSFSRGFSHTLLSVLYAGIWAGIATFVYMAFFDQGYIFDQYLLNLQQPEMQQMMRETGLTEQIKTNTGGLTLSQVIEQLRDISAGTYAAMIIYLYLLSAPILALIGGFIGLRRSSRI